jgi:hypothetical protein
MRNEDSDLRPALDILSNCASAGTTISPLAMPAVSERTSGKA